MAAVGSVSVPVEVSVEPKFNLPTATLLAALDRRLAYLLQGWQESYTSAQYWRKRASAAEAKLALQARR